jgi:hypothetical protein
VAGRYPTARGAALSPSAYSTATVAAVFLCFTAVGCGYIILAKLADIGPFYVTFVPVGLMLGYALLIYLARGLRLRDDQSGDNLYYMGFLFTLTSLGVSLYQFTASRAAEEIVQNFGIAIGSTITGIGLRVIFNQMRRDPIEVERMMRLELAEAARRVRRELDSTVVEFGYHRRSAQQAAADSFNHVAEKFDEIVARFVASLEQTTSKLSAPLEAASRRSEEAIGEVTKTIGTTLGASARQLQGETDKLSIRVGAIAATLEQLMAKLREMQTPDRVIEVRLEPVSHALAQAVDRFAAQSDAQAAAVTNVLQETSATTRQSLSLMVAAREELGSTAVSNRVALEAAGKAVVGVGQIVDELKAGAQHYVEILRALLEKTDGTMRTFTDVLVKSGVETAAQADWLREALPAIEANAQTLVMAAERMSRAAEDLRASHLKPEREAIG